MPNPKKTVARSPLTSPRRFEKSKAGRVEFRVDKTSLIHIPVGKLSVRSREAVAQRTWPPPSRCGGARAPQRGQGHLYQERLGMLHDVTWYSSGHPQRVEHESHWVGRQIKRKGQQRMRCWPFLFIYLLIAFYAMRNHPGCAAVQNPHAYQRRRADAFLARNLLQIIEAVFFQAHRHAFFGISFHELNIIHLFKLIFKLRAVWLSQKAASSSQSF